MYSEVEGRSERHSEREVEGEAGCVDPWRGGTAEYGTPHGGGEAEVYIEGYGEAEVEETEGRVDPRGEAIAGYRTPHMDPAVEMGKRLLCAALAL